MRFIFLFLFLLTSFFLYSQKELIVLKRGHVVAQYAEGEYFKCVLKKKHRHTEGHILELNNFSMITSSDTIAFKDIDRIDIRGHRGPPAWNRGVGGLLFMGGLIYLGIDQLNAAIGVHSASLTPTQLYTPLAISGVGAMMVFIRPKYLKIKYDMFIHTIDYKSPFFQK
ncbi:MAG: hypothetical protein JST48_10150 [Bacteroidetes bacterium]|nr:hypothetical protein [Bacteroidota bacterium]